MTRFGKDSQTCGTICGTVVPHTFQTTVPWNDLGGTVERFCLKFLQQRIFQAISDGTVEPCERGALAPLSGRSVPGPSLGERVERLLPPVGTLGGRALAHRRQKISSRWHCSDGASHCRGRAPADAYTNSPCPNSPKSGRRNCRFRAPARGADQTIRRTSQIGAEVNGKDRTTY
jgi:hypothetical protein